MDSSSPDPCPNAKIINTTAHSASLFQCQHTHDWSKATSFYLQLFHLNWSPPFLVFSPKYWNHLYSFLFFTTHVSLSGNSVVSNNASRFWPPLTTSTTPPWRDIPFFSHLDCWSSLHYSDVGMIFSNISHSMSLEYSTPCHESPHTPSRAKIFTMAYEARHNLCLFHVPLTLLPTSLALFPPLQPKLSPYSSSNMLAGSGLRSLPFRGTVPWTWDALLPHTIMVKSLSIIARVSRVPIFKM